MRLSKNFFLEEAICDYRVYRGTKDVWAVNLDLLEVFQKLCEKHGLRFFMGFGTLLGAVRHQGFIPWDDDVDLLMPRQDFEQLKKFAAEISPPYFLQTEDNDSEFWHRGMMKFRNSSTTCIERRNLKVDFNQGIALEILPLDSVPDAVWKRWLLGTVNGWYQHLRWAKRYSVCRCFDAELYPKWYCKIAQYLKWGFFRGLSKSFSRKWLQVQLYALWTRYKGQVTESYTMYTGLSWRIKCIPVKLFSSAVPMAFENLSLPAPVGARKLLLLQYGENFLYRPTEIWRFPHHPALWSVDTAYDVYQARFRGALHPAEGAVIVLFGTGKMVFDYQRRWGKRLQPAFYVDNNPKKWNTHLQGIPVRNPECLLNIPQDKLHVIICNNFYREIGRQLQEMGISRYYIYSDNLRSGPGNPVFGTPNDIGCFSRNKLAHVGYALFEPMEGAKILGFLKDAKQKCEFLIAVLLLPVEADGLDILAWLRELELVDCTAAVRPAAVAESIGLYRPDGLFFLGKAEEYRATAEACLPKTKKDMAKWQGRKWNPKDEKI